MPKVNVYLSDDLADAVRKLDLPLSNICQQALQHAVDRIELADSRPTGLLSRFDDKAKALVVAAQTQARDLLHNYVGTEHLLLGILSDASDPSAAMLAPFDVTLESCRDSIIERVGKGKSAIDSRPAFTPRAKRVLELSMRESLKDGSNVIGPEHVLLALVAESNGLAAKILSEAGVKYGDVSMRLRTRSRRAVRSAIATADITFMGLTERRLKQLQDEMTTEFATLREEFELQRAKAEALETLVQEHGLKAEIRPADQSRSYKCSFCGKKQAQTKKLIAGPGVAICDECLTLCNEIVEEETPPQPPE